MKRHESVVDNLYDYFAGEEDARVCKDIPEEACNAQPVNFFTYLGANVLTKIGDELASAKLVLPWLLSALGAPAAIAGFLVPIRESGALLPQMLVAAYIRQLAIRKVVWVLGSVLQGIAVLAIAGVALALEGTAAGWAILGLLVAFSLARGISSVAAKDVLGKTVSKTRRGTLMGWSAAVSGAVTLAVGAYVQWFSTAQTDRLLFAGLLGVAGILWLVAGAVFMLMREQPGATEGGGNALVEAWQSLGTLRRDRGFRRFVIGRALLLGVPLAVPFYVVLAQQQAGGDLAGLGLLIIASGVAAAVSSPVWGRLGDRSSRLVMVAAAGLAGVLGVVTWALVISDAGVMSHSLTYAVLYLLLAVAHSGARLGRKTYLVDMATAQNRATYVALSNTVIGIALLAGGLFGIIGDVLGTSYVILALSLMSLVGAFYCLSLEEVSG